MKKTILYLSLSILFSTQSFALDKPKTSRYDDRMQYINYNANDVTEIKAKDGFVTAISFANNEEVKDIAIGFDRGWEIVDSNNHLYLKPNAVGDGDNIIEPKIKDWDTNLIVTTNKRYYAFDLKLINKNDSAYLMKFAYPKEEREKALKQKQLERAKAEEKLLAKRKVEYEKSINSKLNKFTIPKNWDYVMQVGKDSRTIAPVFAYDDGTRTYLGFDSTKSIPSVFYYQGNQEMISNVSMKTQGQYAVVVIHKTAVRFILRSGKQVVGIINNGFGKNPSRNNKTTNSDILRVVK
ncbi:P-type conjugative transfer protein VirB9 [Pasteurella atlantica]|uniref:P-type conjugative transfer protein VirB9 n=1 Tax=Phocoenobacter atlanticus TaxID=3416742 RepID=UPI0027634197|nr:P-type conjugative transfer protein VirB9 [Pasteurella atlantica]MDP8042531.1 P-type conjugative transfer protein VirB9 [Pasteurella atlantica]